MTAATNRPSSLTKWIPVILMIVLGAGFGAGQAFRLNKQFQDVDFYVREPLMHPLLARTLSLDLAGAVAGVSWLNMVAFYGDRLLQSRIVGADYHWLWKSLQSQLYLDRFSIDTYQFAVGVFPWRANRPEYSLQLLLYGAAARTQDWRIYLSLGYHLFAFFKEPELAAEVWKIASELEGRPDWLPSLTTMLMYEHRDLDGALAFLQAMNSGTSGGNDVYNQELQKMQQTISTVKKLQELADRYATHRGRTISSLDDLVKTKMIRFLPLDPFGGAYFWDAETGRVDSTTRLVPSRKGRNEDKPMNFGWLKVKVAQNLLDPLWNTP